MTQVLWSSRRDESKIAQEKQGALLGQPTKVTYAPAGALESFQIEILEEPI
jgi:hypothetical protein